MVDNETIDSFLIQMNKPAQEIGDGIWRVDDEDDGVPAVIVSHTPPIVTLRLPVLDEVPEARRMNLYRKLLELNNDSIAFGAYALDGEEVVLVDTLGSDDLDMSELRSSLESLIVAAQEHYSVLRGLVEDEE